MASGEPDNKTTTDGANEFPTMWESWIGERIRGKIVHMPSGGERVLSGNEGRASKLGIWCSKRKALRETTTGRGGEHRA